MTRQVFTPTRRKTLTLRAASKDCVPTGLPSDTIPRPLAALAVPFGQKRLHDPLLQSLRMTRAPVPRRAITGANVSQMHYARKGIITPEMDSIAIRENLVRAQLKERLATERLPKPGQSFGALMSQQVTPEFVRDEVELGLAGKRPE